MPLPSHRIEKKRPVDHSSGYLGNSIFLTIFLAVGIEILKFLVYGACFYMLVSLLMHYGSTGSSTSASPSDVPTEMPLGEKVGIGMVIVVGIIMLPIIIFAPSDKKTGE